MSAEIDHLAHQVERAIKLNDLPGMNAALSAARSARPECIPELIDARNHALLMHAEVQWRDGHKDPLRLLRTWLLNAASGWGHDVDALRKGFAIARSMESLYGDCEASMTFRSTPLMGLKASSTEEEVLGWGRRIQAARISVGNSFLKEPMCRVLEHVKEDFGYSWDDTDSNDFAVLRARIHSNAYVELACYSFYDDNCSQYRSYGSLFTSQASEDMDAWVATRPGLKQASWFVRAIDRHVLESGGIDDDVREAWKPQLEKWPRLETLLMQAKEQDRVMTLRYNLGRPIALAAALGSVETIRALAHAGAIPARVPADQGSISPMHQAARMGRNEVIDLLASKGVNVNERDELGQTPLMLAVQERSMRAIQALLALGADVRAIDKDGHDVRQRLERGYLPFDIQGNDERSSEEEVSSFLNAHEARSAIARAAMAGSTLAPV